MGTNDGTGLSLALSDLSAESNDLTTELPINLTVTLPVDAAAQLVRLARSYGLPLRDVASVLLVGSLHELDQFGVSAPNLRVVRQARCILRDRTMKDRRARNVDPSEDEAMRVRSW